LLLGSNLKENGVDLKLDVRMKDLLSLQREVTSPDPLTCVDCVLTVLSMEFTELNSGLIDRIKKTCKAAMYADITSAGWTACIKSEEWLFDRTLSEIAIINIIE
jgi:hypothetical protein